MNQSTGALTSITLGSLYAAAAHRNRQHPQEKQAAPKWVKLLRQGKLSPAATNRIARESLEPGKYRQVRELGRGQFSLADDVVANVGDTPGRMVLKQPTRAPQPGHPPMQTQYKKVQEATEALNRQFQLPGQPPPIAPVHQVTPRGMYQAKADAKVEVPEELEKLLADIRGSHNRGPGGQIYDFDFEKTKKTPLKPQGWRHTSELFKLTPIDQPVPGKSRDVYGNLAEELGKKPTPAQLKALKRSDDLVRKYNAAKTDQERAKIFAQIVATAPQRAEPIVSALQGGPKPPVKVPVNRGTTILSRDARAATHVPPPPGFMSRLMQRLRELFGRLRRRGT